MSNPSYDELWEAFTIYKTANGWRKARDLIKKHGGDDGLESVPEVKRAALLAAFDDGAIPDDAPAKPKAPHAPHVRVGHPRSIADLDHDAIWARFNSAGRNQKA